MSKSEVATKENYFRKNFGYVSRLKETKVLTFCGMMAAMSIVLKQVATIKVGPFLRIGLAPIPNQIVDYIFGPLIGSIFAMVMDLVNLVLSGEASSFMPGITFSAMLGAMIYGLFLYNKPIKLWRIIVSQFLVKLICNVCLNSFFLNVLYGTMTTALFWTRVGTNAGKFVIDVPLMYFLYQFINKTIKPYYDERKI